MNIHIKLNFYGNPKKHFFPISTIPPLHSQHVFPLCLHSCVPCINVNKPHDAKCYNILSPLNPHKCMEGNVIQWEFSIHMSTMLEIHGLIHPSCCDMSFHLTISQVECFNGNGHKFSSKILSCQVVRIVGVLGNLIKHN
jgi:hypothetical protein